ncbi:putative nuclease HARBI1 [Leptopilina boulardi]|uniref:putative nuclease HARBI1 n=1 Tax=Leptopilina boulardi TaxID=63433 RepID=UPI0021F5AC0C|nr:putative nuclease HARBI1 [Leptopilina boulardi]XP_051156970.1 putative nuclease HARBI1 [Leptopilina boulardi]
MSSDSSWTSSSSECDDDINLLLLLLLRRRKRRRRRFWVNFLWMSRKEKGAHNFGLETALIDETMFRKFTRMSVVQYEDLLQKIGPSLISQPTRDDIIDPSTKLMLTLRFLATGESLSSLSIQFRMGNSTVVKWIYKTMKVLTDKLTPIVLCLPKTPAEWKKVADGFERNWQFPHTVGAIDGKHIVMQAQPHSGSINFNYKKQHSLNLLAVCDSEYKFIAVDIGARGRESDGGVFRKSNFGKRLLDRSLNLPPPSAISPTGPILPFYFVADEAFPLDQNIMRPFPGRSTGVMPFRQRIFNYRLSRGRRTIENSFGILCCQWRVFRIPINATEVHIKLIAAAAICLHNYLRKEEENIPEDARRYCPVNFTDRIVDGVEVEGLWRREIQMDAFAPLPPSRRRNLAAINIRECLVDFLLNEGQVPWQNEMVNNGAF